MLSGFFVAIENRQSKFGHSFGGIAQLVERQLCKLEVRGSNPLASISKEMEAEMRTQFDWWGRLSRKGSKRSSLSRASAKRWIIPLPPICLKLEAISNKSGRTIGF